jgi:hypothetical protein
MDFTYSGGWAEEWGSRRLALTTPYNLEQKAFGCAGLQVGLLTKEE